MFGQELICSERVFWGDVSFCIWIHVAFVFSPLPLPVFITWSERSCRIGESIPSFPSLGVPRVFGLPHEAGYVLRKNAGLPSVDARSKDWSWVLLGQLSRCPKDSLNRCLPEAVKRGIESRGPLPGSHNPRLVLVVCSAELFCRHFFFLVTSAVNRLASITRHLSTIQDGRQPLEMMESRVPCVLPVDDAIGAKGGATQQDGFVDEVLTWKQLHATLQFALWLSRI